MRSLSDLEVQAVSGGNDPGAAGAEALMAFLCVLLIFGGYVVLTSSSD
jgi:hypothetical protein